MNSSSNISESLKKWREDTPGCNYRIHLNNAGAALMPKPVITSIYNHLELETHIGGYEAADEAADSIAESYTHIGNLIGTEAANIAIVENATVATLQALSVFDFQRGDTIITTNVDYASNQIMLLSLVERFGVKIVRAEDLQEGGVDVESVRNLIQKHRPKLLLMSWIPTNSGLIQDAHAVGSVCRNEDVPFLLDACQAAGQLPIDVNDLNCDFLAATSRKFLRGPRGIGFLYVSNRMLERDPRPLFPDTHGARWAGPDQYKLEPKAKRFENWEFPYALVLGMGAAAKYACDIGVEICSKRATELAKYTREKLKSVPGSRLLDRGSDKCAIVSLSIKNKDPAVLVNQLRTLKINTSSASHTAGVIDLSAKNAESILRISPHYYNTVEEIDEMVQALYKIVER